MFRRWAFLCALSFFFFFVLALAQTKNSSTSQLSTTAATSSSPEEDDDSADIPPFARGHLGEQEYLRLRDQQIRQLRGVDDLIRDPGARSRAIHAMESREQVLRQKRAQSGAAGASSVGPAVIWNALGPDPIPNGQVQSGAEIPVSGRITALAIDPTDSTGNTVYVGAAQGGVYRTTDGGATWTALMDNAQSLSIGSLTLDPTDHTVLFVGTGEGNFALDSFFGVGLYVITNANGSSSLNGPFNHPTTFPLADPDGFTDVFTGRAITQILVNPGNHNQILVSTSSGFSGASSDVFSTLPTRGVYLSTNVFTVGSTVGTPTFQRLTIQTAAGTANRPVTDMVIDPGNANLVLVNVFGQTGTEGGIWASPSTVWAGTGSWTQTLQTGLDVNGKFAVNRSGGTPTTTFFVGLDQTPATGACTREGTLFSAANNGGTSWSEIAAARGFCGGQCFYDITLAVDPTTTNNIYLGGSADSGAGPSCNSNAFIKSTTGGTSFVRSDTQLHADSHAVAILPSNPLIIYEGNDGGIFRSADGGATWTSRNTAGFNATQFESIAVHPTDPNFTIGGTQDNGTPLLMPDGVSWNRADFGDGGFSGIDQNATNTTNVTMYHTYFNASNNLVGYAQISNGTAAAEGTWNFSGCQGTLPGNGITCADTVLFYAPLTLGPGNPNTVYYGTDRLYRSPDQGNTNTVVSQAPIVANAPISAIGISALSDNIRIVGLAVGRVFATTSGSSTMTEVTGPWTPKYVARAIIDPNNPNTAYVTFDGYGTATHVWKTTNLSAAPPAWNPASGTGGTSIPDVPVNSLVVDPQNSNLVYAATDIGVFNSTDGGATWNPYGSGLPRVAVFDIKVTAKRTVRIATHGRGMFEFGAVAPGNATTVAANSSPSNPMIGTNVTITATVNHAAGVAIPTGTVAFMDGATLLGSVAVGVSGSASFSTTTLAGGAHSIVAAYGGDNNYAASQGTTTVSVSLGDFSLTIPSGSASVLPGQSATYTINVAAVSGFAGTVSFTCTSGLPSLTSCSFNPTTVNTSGSTTLTISTTAGTGTAKPPNTSAGLLTTGGLVGLGLVLAGGVAVRKRRGHALFLLLVVMAVTCVAISCGGGGGGPHNPGTPPGTSSVTITATSGATTHTATVTLNVQ
ncbi:MAG TPA: Ig-like domain-containing protein [Candidatus Angelobacter sp.]|nr:Ig-like domain-containing protein [Candidatus Angelobacter sp.]